MSRTAFVPPGLIVGCLLLISVVGCRKDPPPLNTELLPKIVLVTSGIDSDLDKSIRLRFEAHQNLNQTKYRASVMVPAGTTPEEIATSQTSEIKKLTDDGVDAILLIPGKDEQLVNALVAATEKKVAVVTLGREIDSELLTKSGLKLTHVGIPLNKEVHRLTEQLIKFTPENRQICIVGLSDNQDFSMLQQEFAESLAETQWQIVLAEQITLETGPRAVDVAQSRIKAILEEHSDISALFCCDFNSALGALNALSESKASARVAVVCIANNRTYSLLLDAGADVIGVLHYDHLAVSGIDMALREIAGGTNTGTGSQVALPIEVIQGSSFEAKLKKQSPTTSEKKGTVASETGGNKESSQSAE
jgi:ABC-type sugar transport system substrate-binding protein